METAYRSDRRQFLQNIFRVHFPSQKIYREIFEMFHLMIIYVSEAHTELLGLRFP